MKKQAIIGLLYLLLLQGYTTFACQITPSFSNSQSHTCGLPTIVSVTNTSTGSLSNSAKYWWKINYTKATDTIIGKTSNTFFLKRPGANYVKLFVKDSAGCIDSSGVTITVTTNAKSILDQNLVYTYQPTWMNCLQFITDPDSFRVNFESADTLKNLRIIWGDGNTDYSGNDLAPNTVKTHLYNSLGIFTIKIITTNGACTDTVYGTVYNQRQPTAGIIGPASGSNRGCVPHTLRIINNSYNISNNTTFLIDWGNGDTETKPYNTYNDTIYHTYTKGICAGIIKITATNVCGSSFSTWNPIDISDRDKALWSVASTCNPTGNFVFQNLSTDLYCLVPDIKEYFWDFGDSTTFGWTGSKASQSHNYKKEGTYIVSLIAKTACGNDTFRGVVNVFYNPVAGMKISNQRGCRPLSVTLTDTSKGRGLSRLWTVNDGGTVKTFTDSILNYTFTKAGNNTVNLTVTNICNSSSITRTFVVTDKPKSSFTTINSSCIPVTQTFTNTSTSYFSNPSYLWDFGDGTSSTLKNPSAKIYSTPGTYIVKLIITDSCGSDTSSQTFTAYNLPQAIVSGDTVACTFDTVRFVNTSINSNQYNWQFGDNQSLTVNDTLPVKHVYTVPGTYTVLLISGTSSGCKDTASIKVLIKPGAKADFSFDKIYGCTPAKFKVTNNSIYGKDYYWFANGQLISTANQPNDTTLYTDTTIIKLKLIATSNSSCQSDSLEKNFFTAKNPIASIAPKDSGCGPLTLKLKNNSTYALTYNWNLGNGTTSTLAEPTGIFPSAGSKDTVYYPTLIAQNWAGCMDTTLGSIVVYPGPGANFSMNLSDGCGPLSINFSNLSTTNNSEPFSSLKHNWQFGDGSSDSNANTSHVFHANSDKDTIYSVSLQITSINGCTNTLNDTVRVYPQPKIQFVPDKSDGCALLNVHFQNQSSPGDTGSIQIMSFNWTNGNGQSYQSQDIDAIYNSSLYGDTVYIVKLIGTNEHGCTDSLTKYITVHPQPVAAFTTNFTSICTPATIVTYNQSVSKDGLPLSHEWDFGNGYISTSITDSTMYFNNSDSDTYHTITYQAISSFGCRDTALASITVRPKPRVSINLNNLKVCAPALITLSDSSVNASQYYWAEGNNIYSNSSFQTISLPGLKLFDTTYIIAHSVASQFGCPSDTIYRQIYVYGRPDAGFALSKDSTCSRESVHLLNSSLGAFKYNWNFGDNTASSAINPIHKFNINSGNGNDTVFNIVLEAISPLNCKDTVTKPLTLVTPTTQTIGSTNPLGCTDLNSEFVNLSSQYKTVYWDPGDNSGYVTGDTLVHTYKNISGNTTLQPKITLIRSKHNCRDTVSTYAFVYPKPTAAFKVQRTDPCNDGTHLFINQSTFSNSITWFVDSSSISNFNSFTMKLPGSVIRDSQYAVRLIVNNSYNCADTMDQVVKVKAKLLLDFVRNPITACENTSVNFTNKSFNVSRYLWNFGDGALSNEVNPTHTYNVFGNYKITLYGYDKDGCVDSSTGSTFIKILERPKADFTYLPNFPKLPNAKVDFNATPTILTANVNDLSYDWDFGDGNYPENNFQQMNPSHIYTKSGTVAITLKVANQGCDDAVTKYLFIEDPKPTVNFTADTLEGCAPFKVSFKNSTTNVQTYRWIFGDGTPDSYEKEPTHIFTLPGTWDVTLVATGTGGTSTLTKQYLITTYPQPVLDFYTVNRFLSLPNAIFNMRNNSNSVYNSWDVFDSTGSIIQSSKLREPSFIINTLGQFSIRLIGENSYGCVDTMIKTNYIGTLGQGFVFVPNSFSPNYNGKNDGFMPSLVNVKDRNYTFRVFNRWGELVFETTDINAFWDGTFKGETCEQDVYIWTVNGEYFNGDLFGFRGTVTLLK